jgi:hypothetical protein
VSPFVYCHCFRDIWQIAHKQPNAIIKILVDHRIVTKDGKWSLASHNLPPMEEDIGATENRLFQCVEAESEPRIVV